MDALTLDLLFTVAACAAVLSCAGIGIALLPWKAEHWVPLPEEDPLPNGALGSPSRP